MNALPVQSFPLHFSANAVVNAQHVSAANGGGYSTVLGRVVEEMKDEFKALPEDVAVELTNPVTHPGFPKEFDAFWLFNLFVQQAPVFSPNTVVRVRSLLNGSQFKDISLDYQGKGIGGFFVSTRKLKESIRKTFAQIRGFSAETAKQAAMRKARETRIELRRHFNTSGVLNGAIDTTQPLHPVATLLVKSPLRIEAVLERLREVQGLNILETNAEEGRFEYKGQLFRLGVLTQTLATVPE